MTSKRWDVMLARPRISGKVWWVLAFVLGAVVALVACGVLGVGSALLISKLMGK